MTEKIKTNSRDAATAALVLVNEARRDLEDGWVRKADANLYIAQRLLLSAGATDIGPIPEPRDLTESHELREKLHKKTRKISELEERINELEPRE